MVTKVFIVIKGNSPSYLVTLRLSERSCHSEFFCPLFKTSGCPLLYSSGWAWTNSKIDSSSSGKRRRGGVLSLDVSPCTVPGLSWGVWLWLASPPRCTRCTKNSLKTKMRAIHNFRDPLHHRWYPGACNYTHPKMADGRHGKPTFVSVNVIPWHIIRVNCFFIHVSCIL
jgi:hypothetical protein